MMERIGDAVRSELGRFGTAGPMADLVELWPRAVGDTIAANAWPARFTRDGILVVHTSASAWAFELTQLEATLRERLGEQAPTRLKFVVGPLPEPAADAGDEARERRPEPSPDDVARAAELVVDLDDENLRNLVSRAASLSLARARIDR
jgi:hypothetical protein